MPTSRTTPDSSTAPRSATASPERAFCSTSSTVRPSLGELRDAANTCLRDFGSRPIDGSSSRISAGSSISERASSTCFCSPPDSDPAASLRRWRRSGTRRRPRVRSADGLLVAAGRSRPSAGSPRPSSPGTGCGPAARARCRAAAARGGEPVDGLAAKRTEPWRGRSRPLIVLSTVDLPAPFGPIRQMTCRPRPSRSTPLRMSPAP